MFGEISMLYNTNRTANIKVKSKTICFKLTRKAFNSIIRQKNMKKTKTLMEIMNKIDIFN
jgi:CRP-like cAMP-binding protein